MSDFPSSDVPNLIDRSVKALFRECPNAVMRLAGVEVEPERIRVEDPNLNLPELRADHVFIIEEQDTSASAIYLEYQLEPDADLLTSWAAKWGGLLRQLKMPVVLLALYLHRGDRANFPDRLLVRVGGIETELRFTAIRLWEHAARIRSGELPELAPLLVLCEESPTVATVQEEVALIHASQLSPETQAELLGIALLVASRQFARELLRPIFEEDFSMIQEIGIVEEWLIEREARGRAEGEAKSAREILMRQGRKRFGEPSEGIVQALEAIVSAETLQDMAVRLLEVESWEDLLAPA